MAKKLTYFYLVPLELMLAAAAVFSLCGTTYFELYMQNEVPSYQKDHPLTLLLFLVAAIFLLFGLWLIAEKHSVIAKGLPWLSCFWAVALSSFFVLTFRCGVVCDSGAISEYAIQFMKGNYEAFQEGSYLYHFPFQLGMIAFLELLYRLLGVENFLVFQVINILAITGIVRCLQKITGLLFEKKGVCNLEMLLSMGMLPLYLYASLVYGDVIGMFLGVAASYHGILFLQRERKKELLYAGLLLMLAQVVKSNTAIMLVALVIALLLKMLQEKKVWLLGWILLLALMSQAGVATVNGIYAARSGQAVPEGVPKTAWIAMGLQEAVETDNGCGWYNGYNMHVYEENGYDRQKAQAACIQNIEQSIRRFAHNPRDTVYFFYRKFVSQWNDPSFESMLVSEWYSRYTEGKSALADSLIYGGGRRILLYGMNLYHFLFLVCAAAGGWLLLRHWRLDRAYYGLNIFGGFLFHMLWEAKGRYVLVYFVMLLPIAAAGCEGIMEFIRRRREK